MKKITVLLILALSFWGCASFSRSYKLGTEAAMNKDWDEAVKHYERAVLENPKNSFYRIALNRAKLSASSAHIARARKLAVLGKTQDALAEYEIALFYDPGPYNKLINDEAKMFREGKEREEKPEVQRIEPPIKLLITDEKMGLKFTQEASLRSIFLALGKHAKINIIFDEAFRDKGFAVDLSDMTFEQALNTLCIASKNFYRIIDERIVIIVPDQPVNRAKYELTVVKTFYLSNIEAQEIQGHLQQVLRTPYKAPSIIVNKSLNSVTVRDIPAIVELAERIIRRWDKPKGEVFIDLEIMEVSRIRLRELGLDFSQHGVGARYSGTEESSWLNLNDIDLSKKENFQISIPAAVFQLLESDSDTKILSQPRFRGVDGEPIEYLVGDEVPIPKTTFMPIAAGGVGQQPFVSFDYKDVGIDIKITPHIHFEGEVTLELEIKIKAIGGIGYADIPIISTRDIKNVIRLKDGETNLLAGLLKDEERRTKSGIIGLKSIPLLGDLFSKTDQTIQQTDVVMTITPHIIRTIPLSEEDAKPLWVNLEGGTSLSAQSAQRIPEEALLDPELRRQRMLQERARAQQAGQNQVFLNPSNFEVPRDREFRINVNLRSQEEIATMSLSLSFNAQAVELKQIVMGGFVRQFGEKPSFLENIDNSSGVCTIGVSSTDLSKGYRGSGGIATLVFQSIAAGECTVSVTSITAHSPTGEALTFETRDSRVRVR